MNEMINETTWAEFKNSGLFWLTNSILHLFGYSIVMEYDEGEIKRVYPARVKYRGFSPNINDMGYYKVSKYLSENIETLLSERDKPEDLIN